MSRIYMILSKQSGDMCFSVKYTDDPMLVKQLLEEENKNNSIQTNLQLEVQVYALDTLPKVVKLDIKTDEMWEVSENVPVENLPEVASSSTTGEFKA